MAKDEDLKILGAIVVTRAARRRESNRTIRPRRNSIGAF
jgi:hypothetical protein